MPSRPGGQAPCYPESLTLGGEGEAQPELLHLAARCRRQLADETDQARYLERRQPGRRVLAQFRLGGGGTRSDLGPGVADLPEPFVRDSERGCPQDGWVRLDRRLDLDRIHEFPSDPVAVAATAEERDVASTVHRGEVTGTEPAIRIECLGSSLRLLVVLPHNRRSAHHQCTW